MSIEMPVNSKLPIGICCDHGGYEAKKYILTLLDKDNIKYIDFGTYSNESCDYPDFAHKLGNAIDNGECEFGIAICSTGNGINITMNKHKKVRSALCWNEYVASMARAHNNANVLALPGALLSGEELLSIYNVFMNNVFDGGRHQRRIDKIPL